MERLCPDVDSRLRRLADSNVRSHLGKLETEGRLTVHAGKPRTPTPDEVARAAAEERDRAEAIREADEYRDAARRRALFLQKLPNLLAGTASLLSSPEFP